MTTDAFSKIYNNSKEEWDGAGYVNKTTLINGAMKKYKKSREQVYRMWEQEKYDFETLKRGKITYIKLIPYTDTDTDIVSEGVLDIHKLTRSDARTIIYLVEELRITPQRAFNLMKGMEGLI